MKQTLRGCSVDSKAFPINPIATTDTYEQAAVKKLHSQKLKSAFISENTHSRESFLTVEKLSGDVNTVC